MKKWGFFLFAMLIVSGCGGGGDRGDDDVTIVLTGLLTLGTTAGGQGNPAPSGVVTITELNNKSDTLTQPDNGEYSISGVPVGGNYTVRVTDPNNPIVNVTCVISIPDSTTLNVTSQSSGTCTPGNGNIGELVLNITTA